MNFGKLYHLFEVLIGYWYIHNKYNGIIITELGIIVVARVIKNIKFLPGNSIFVNPYAQKDALIIKPIVLKITTFAVFQKYKRKYGIPLSVEPIVSNTFA